MPVRFHRRTSSKGGDDEVPLLTPERDYEAVHPDAWVVKFLHPPPIPWGRYGVPAITLEEEEDYNVLVWCALKDGENIDQKVIHPLSGKNTTALQHAVRSGWEEVVQLLLENGADPNMVIDGRAPIHWAVDQLRGKNRSHAIVSLLVKHKADLSIRDKDRRLVLYKAVKNGDVDAVKTLLVDGHMDANATNKNGRGITYLHLAAEHISSLPILKLLLSHGALVNAKDNHMYTPISYALSYRNTAAIDLLVEHGAVLQESSRS